MASENGIEWPPPLIDRLFLLLFTISRKVLRVSLLNLFVFRILYCLADLIPSEFQSMRCERDRHGGKGPMFLLDDFLYIIQFRKDNNPMKDCNNLL